MVGRRWSNSLTQGFPPTTQPFLIWTRQNITPSISSIPHHRPGIVLPIPRSRGGIRFHAGIVIRNPGDSIEFRIRRDVLQIEYSTELRDSGENIIVGGANCWGYHDSFVNWDFYPSPLRRLRRRGPMVRGAAMIISSRQVRGIRFPCEKNAIVFVFLLSFFFRRERRRRSDCHESNI